MRKPVRIGIVVAATAGVLVLGFVGCYALCASDTITFTKKIQAVELPSGPILTIYRTSTWEYYDCKFELRDRTGRVVIPKTHFYSTPYSSSKSAAGKSTPEMRTRFQTLVGAKSRVIGIVASTDDKEIVLALIDS